MNVDDDDGGRRWQRNHGSMPLNRLQLNKIQRKIIRRIVFDEIVYAMHGYGPGRHTYIVSHSGVCALCLPL